MVLFANLLLLTLEANMEVKANHQSPCQGSLECALFVGVQPVILVAFDVYEPRVVFRDQAFHGVSRGQAASGQRGGGRQRFQTRMIKPQCTFKTLRDGR